MEDLDILAEADRLLRRSESLLGTAAESFKMPAVVAVQVKSSNRKLAPQKQETAKSGRPRNVPVGPYVVSTYVSIEATCPDSCRWKNNGCYAQTGFTRSHMSKRELASRRMTSLEVTRAEAERIDGLYSLGVPQDGARGGRDLRLHVAGDLGWSAAGEYRYDATQRNGRRWPRMPESWLKLASEVAGEHPWDSAIVNWYDADASLGWHADINEFDLTRPIVTVSLGDTCSWAVRESPGSPVHRCKLETGAVTVLEGETRGWLHTVDRIIPAPLFSPLRSRGRVSVTIRVAGDPRRSTISS
jgi:alkylated DNA repair protein (DNA oxidative demethylase)